MRTARAKRLPARTVHLGHALPNALTASLTLGGLILTSMVAGTVLVENVLPGRASGMIVSSILNKDYQVVQAIVLSTAWACCSSTPSSTSRWRCSTRAR